jgi:hypothetical protein
MNVKPIRFFYKWNVDRNVYLTTTGEIALLLFSDPNWVLERIMSFHIWLSLQWFMLGSLLNYLSSYQIIRFFYIRWKYRNFGGNPKCKVALPLAAWYCKNIRFFLIRLSLQYLVNGRYLFRISHLISNNKVLLCAMKSLEHWNICNPKCKVMHNTFLVRYECQPNKILLRWQQCCILFRIQTKFKKRISSFDIWLCLQCLVYGRYFFRLSLLISK